MNHDYIIAQLARNKNVFEELLKNIDAEEQGWKSEPDKWCLLEIVCHLYDEEREDFRARCKHTLNTPKTAMPSIDPEGWVTARKYMEQDYSQKLTEFLNEREQSITWLKSLENPEWRNSYKHEEFGDLTANMFLTNWLAHDYLHIRQIMRCKFEYLKQVSDEKLIYAGEW